MSAVYDEQIENGKIQFENRFVNQVKAKSNFDIGIEWNNKADFDTVIWKFAVHINKERIIMGVSESDLADFGADGPEDFRQKLLDEKEKELFDKLKS